MLFLGWGSIFCGAGVKRRAKEAERERENGSWSSVC